MEAKIAPHPLDANIEALAKKVATEGKIRKGNGKRLEPFERIVLEGEGPTTTEIIVQGRR
jgi:hypothetical protein